MALDRTTPVLPVEILGNQTQHPSGGDLLILVAVTSTCCTMQVCWQHQHVIGLLLHKGAPHLHWWPCRQPCPFMQAQHRRNAIRQSWALTTAKSPSPVDLKFVLAQPNNSKIADAHSLLQVHFVTYVALFCCFDRSFCTHADHHTEHSLQACVCRPKCAIRTSCLCAMRSCTITFPRRRSTSCAMPPWPLPGDTTQVGTKMPHACLSIYFLACWFFLSACAKTSPQCRNAFLLSRDVSDFILPV